MLELKNAPNVLGLARRSYVCIRDVELICGCSKSKASLIIVEVNEQIKSEGGIVMPQGKANKYMFAKKLMFPIETINEVIDYVDAEQFENRSAGKKKTKDARRVKEAV